MKIFIFKNYDGRGGGLRVSIGGKFGVLSSSLFPLLFLGVFF